MADNHFFFWKNWRKDYRIVYTTSLLISAMALLIYLIQLITGTNSVIDWEINNELQDTPIILDTFTKGLFNFIVEAQTYLVLEQFGASNMQVNITASYILAIFLIISLLLILSLLTELSRLYYIAGMGLFILLLASFKFDILRIFGITNNSIFIGAVALYAGTSYYFYAFKTDVTLPVRLFIFAGITIVISITVLLFSQTSFPVLSIVNHGIIIPVLVCIAFTVMISHEIVHAFLYLVTQSGSVSNKNSLLHLTVITFIYLVNLALAYLHNTKIIDWDILYINAFLLYAVSVILGLWGYRKRNILFNHILDFTPTGAFLYLALAIISTATIGYFFATANDPMTEMLEDVIIFSHLAMGISFFIYIFINFKALFKKNLAVYKVVYQPNRYPFFIARGVGLIIIMALFFRSNMYPFYQSVAGYNNGLGDLYTAKKEYFLAEQYYKLGVQYDFQNHKSNYAAASLARIQEDEATAVHYFKQALLKNPSPYAFISLSNLYQQEGLFFESLFNLQKSVRVFPNSGELYNNLALTYQRANVPDSALIYYDLAENFANKPEVVQTNLLAFWIKNNSIADTDSLLQAIPEREYIPLQNNKLVLATINNSQTDQDLAPFIIQDSILTRERFAYLFNYLLNHRNRKDTILNNYISKFENQQANSVFVEDVRFARASYEYYANDRSLALTLLSGLTQETAIRRAYFNKIMGLWWLQQDAFQLAAQHFNQAIQAGDSSMQTNYAIALSEAGQWQQAFPVWQEQVSNSDPEIRSMAGRMQIIAQALMNEQPVNAIDGLDDAGKALLVHFSEDTLLTQVPQRINEPEYQILAWIEITQEYLDRENTAEAEKAYQAATQIDTHSAQTKATLHLLHLQIMAAKGEYQALLATIEKRPKQRPINDQQLYWQARAYEQSNNLQQATQFYEQALRRMPVNAEVVRDASIFFNTKQKNEERAYAILLEAIRLNPYSVPLQKAYILQSLNMQLFTYAEQALKNLASLTTATDYQSFLREYTLKKASVENSLSDWE